MHTMPECYYQWRILIQNFSVPPPPPKTGPIRLFLHRIFAKKCLLWRFLPLPSHEGCAPQQEILDPPLIIMNYQRIKYDKKLKNFSGSLNPLPMSIG